MARQAVNARTVLYFVARHIDVLRGALKGEGKDSRQMSVFHCLSVCAGMCS